MPPSRPRALTLLGTRPVGAPGQCHVAVDRSGRYAIVAAYLCGSVAIDDATGRLSLVGHEPTKVETARNFAIDPNGTLLLAANGALPVRHASILPNERGVAPDQHQEAFPVF
jgi:6-phosphogluconolactonase (cycloisomerase 2 family)